MRFHLPIIQSLVDSELTDVSDGSNSWVDARDVAHALVLAVAAPGASGQRIIVASGAFRWQDFGESFPQ